jgi:hypothetical protein
LGDTQALSVPAPAKDHSSAVLECDLHRPFVGQVAVWTDVPDPTHRLNNSTDHPAQVGIVAHMNEGSGPATTAAKGAFALLVSALPAALRSSVCSRRVEQAAFTQRLVERHTRRAQRSAHETARRSMPDHT